MENARLSSDFEDVVSADDVIAEHRIPTGVHTVRAALPTIGGEVQHDIDSLECETERIDILDIRLEYALLRQGIHAAAGQSAQLVPVFQCGPQCPADDPVQPRHKKFGFPVI